MPVDREQLEAVLREAVDGDGELYALLHQKMLANDKIASSFLGGYLRNKDYTSKTQALAEERRGMEDAKRTYEGQIGQYRQLLEEAEAGKQQVLRDLAQHKESLSGAYARLKHIKEVYQLGDDDIPAYQDLIDTSRKGKPVDTSTTDIDQKLAQFEQKITSYLTQKLVPELGGLARLPGIMDEVSWEHEQLTGKRLSKKERDEILDEADRRARAGKPISYQQMWEEKFGISDLRQKHHDETLEKKIRQKWDDEQKVRLSEQALQGLHPTAPEGFRTSNILQHKFQVHEEPPAGAPKPRETPSANERNSLTGAERASKRFMERRANGIPMGAPDERKAGNKVA